MDQIDHEIKNRNSINDQLIECALFITTLVCVQLINELMMG